LLNIASIVDRCGVEGVSTLLIIVDKCG